MRFEVGEHLVDDQPARVDRAAGQAIEHERIVRVRTMGNRNSIHGYSDRGDRAAQALDDRADAPDREVDVFVSRLAAEAEADRRASVLADGAYRLQNMRGRLAARAARGPRPAPAI